MPFALASTRNSVTPAVSLRSPAVRALTTSRSALSPCATTLFAPSSTQPPPFGVAVVSTSERS